MLWKIRLERISRNSLNRTKLEKSLKLVCGVARRNKTLRFKAKIAHISEPIIQLSRLGDQNFRYDAEIVVGKKTDDPERAKRQYEHIKEQVLTKATSLGWDSPKPKEILPATISFTPPELTPEVYKTDFADVYEREPHIRMVHDVLTTWIEQGGKPSHVLLYGEPAAAKTTLLEKFKKWYEKDWNHKREIISFVDGPTLTKAGLENWLIDKVVNKTLPYALVIEEIEKQSLDNLLILLSLMGSGRLQKTNARRRFNESVKICILATCNDEGVLQGFRRGALWSRFTHRIPCSQPSKEIIRKILLDKVKERNGNPKWVDAVMRFAFDDYPHRFGRIYGEGDPRSIIGLLDSRDRLLDNTAQADIIEILRRTRKETPALVSV